MEYERVLDRYLSTLKSLNRFRNRLESLDDEEEDLDYKERLERLIESSLKYLAYDEKQFQEYFEKEDSMLTDREKQERLRVKKDN
jgi:hypothetical protein